MTFVRALLGCVHFLQLCAYEKLTDCCNSCLRYVSGLTSLLYAVTGFVTGLIEPFRRLFIVVKTLNVLCWKRAFTVYTVPWRLWDLTYTWYTASCCMLSGCLSLLRSVPYACLALLCCICSQMQEAALQLLWFWTPGWIQTICTALAHSWYSTGKKGSGPAPPGTSSFAFGGFVVTKLIKRALTSSLALLWVAPCACLALLCHICKQMQEAALQLLWSWTPGWIQTICTALAHSWYSTGKKGSGPAPPRTSSFAFGGFVITTLTKRALTSSLALLWGAPSACLAPLGHISSQMQEAALQLLRFWTPGWIQTTCTILAHLWHSTGKEGPAAAPSGTASFAFGGFGITTLIKKALTSSLALLWGAPCACLALLCQIYSQMQKAALQLLWSWTPGWIQTTCTILAHLWHSTGKEGPAAAPSGTASFAFCGYIVTILVKRAKTCPSGVPPSPRGAVVAPEVALDMHPAPAREMHCDDSSSDQHKRGVPDTESTDSDDSQEATKVGFAPVILC